MSAGQNTEYAPIALAEAKRRLAPGSEWDVTNHYITREDHPCFGTVRRSVVRISGSHLYLTHPNADESGVPWKPGSRVPAMTAGEGPGGRVFLFGHPTAGDLFLTFTPAGAQS